MALKSRYVASLSKTFLFFSACPSNRVDLCLQTCGKFHAGAVGHGPADASTTEAASAAAPVTCPSCGGTRLQRRELLPAWRMSTPVSAVPPRLEAPTSVLD